MAKAKKKVAKAAKKVVKKKAIKAAKPVKKAVAKKAPAKKAEAKKVTAKKAASKPIEKASKLKKVAKSILSKITPAKPEPKLKAKKESPAPLAKEKPQKEKAPKVLDKPLAKEKSKKAPESDDDVPLKSIDEILKEENLQDHDNDEVVLTDAEGNPYCKAKDCDQLAVVDGYCRYHYILLWKRIQNRKKILAGGKLDRYIEELTARYPDKYLEMLRKDLASEKDFLAVVAELDIDESLGDSEFDDDSENFIDEMRGVSRDEGDEEF